MAEVKSLINDYNLPLKTVSKIIKDALPEGTEVTIDAKNAIGRAACVFILITTSTHCQYKGNGNVDAEELIKTIARLDFRELFTPLMEHLSEYRKQTELKNDKRKRLNKSIEEIASSLIAKASQTARANKDLGQEVRDATLAHELNHGDNHDS